MSGLEQLKRVLAPMYQFLEADSINEAQARYIKTYLDHSLPFFSAPVFEDQLGPNLIRVTVNKYLPKNNNERIKEINFLKYPPVQAVTKYGRANLVGQSVFYGAFDPVTPLSEMKPLKGDLITVSTWAQKDEFGLTLTPICSITSGDDGKTHNEISFRFQRAYQNSLIRMPNNQSEQIDELVSFMSKCFAKKVKYGNSFDYYLSAYFADRLLNEFEESKLEAIIYPSLAQKMAFSNIAVKPDSFDSKFELIKVEESVITTTPRENGNGYLMSGTGWTKTFDLENGIIDW